MRKSYICLALILLIGAIALASPLIPLPQLGETFSWGLVATVLVILILLAFFFEFEATALSSKEIALVAMLGTLSAVLRIPFAVIPNVQPCTYLIICSGYVFGPVAGFMVGAVTALVSNFFLGQGPWTLYQMLAWGLAGVSASYVRRFKLNTVWLIVFGVIWGYLYGWIMNTWFWLSFIYPLTLKTLAVYQLNSIWFDTFHAIGNVIFLGLFGMKTIAILERFRQRFTWSLAGTGIKAR
jgi:energy-coupling factor transport system substrate-specific component